MHVRSGEDEGLKDCEDLLVDLLSWLMKILSCAKAQVFYFFIVHAIFAVAACQQCALEMCINLSMLVITILLLSCYFQMRHQILVGIFLHCRLCQ